MKARPLRLSCNGTFAMRWLIPRLKRFVALRPDVTVEVSESYAPVDFALGAYDAAIRLTVAPAAVIWAFDSSRLAKISGRVTLTVVVLAVAPVPGDGWGSPM